MMYDKIDEGVVVVDFDNLYPEEEKPMNPWWHDWGWAFAKAGATITLMLFCVLVGASL